MNHPDNSAAHQDGSSRRLDNDRDGDDDALLLRHRSPSNRTTNNDEMNQDEPLSSEPKLPSWSTKNEPVSGIHLLMTPPTRHAVPFGGEKDGHDDDHDDDDDNNDASSISSDDDLLDKCWGWCMHHVHHCIWSTRRHSKKYRKITLRQMWQSYVQYKIPSTGYSWPIFRQDVLAGFTVAILAVPLGMSYARLAGLPVEYGIYASFVPPLVYPLCSSSRHLALGPAALVSLVLNSGLTLILQDDVDQGILSAPGTPEYVAKYTQLAIQCTFLSAVVNLGMGIFRLGFITQLLSRALISGFTSGAAVIIAISQLKHLLGYPIATSNRVHELLKYLAQDIDKFNWKTFVMGTTCIGTLLLFNHVSQVRPKYGWIRALGPFVVSAVTITITTVWNLDEHGIFVVGDIPAGLPSVTVDQWVPFPSKLWMTVLSIVIVGFVQSIAISKRFAYKHGYEIDSSQELIALGMANLIGGMFQSFPVTGALGQSAVNDRIGAQTGMSSIATAMIVLLVLIVMTPIFEKMPLNVLAAVVISFVVGMLDFQEAKYLFKVHKLDFLVWVVAFLGTIFLGVEIGLGFAVALSLLIVMYKAVYPRTAVLGRLPGTHFFRNVKQYPNAERYDGLIVCRINTPLFFANAQSVRDKIRKYKRVAEAQLAERATSGGIDRVKYIILDLVSMSHIDTTALHVLEDMYVTQQKLGVQICFCSPLVLVMKRFIQSGLVDVVGRQHFFTSDFDAVHWCLSEMDAAQQQQKGAESENGNNTGEILANESDGVENV